MYVGHSKTTTDARGRFFVADVSDGDYEVVALLRGGSSGEIEERRACRVDGAPVDVGDLELRSGLSIRGSAVDPEGRGVGRVLVTAWQEGSSGRGANAILMTRSDGSFELPGLEPGTFRIQLVPYEAQDGRRLARILREGVPAGTADLVVRLVEAAELKARVVDSAGKPVPNASVEMVISTGEPGGWEQSDAEGRVAFYPPRGSKVALVAHPEKAEVVALESTGGTQVAVAANPEAGAEVSGPFQYDPDPARAARLDGVDPERGEVVLVLPGPP